MLLAVILWLLLQSQLCSANDTEARKTHFSFCLLLVTRCNNISACEGWRGARASVQYVGNGMLRCFAGCLRVQWYKKPLNGATPLTWCSNWVFCQLILQMPYHIPVHLPLSSSKTMSTDEMGHWGGGGGVEHCCPASSTMCITSSPSLVSLCLSSPTLVWGTEKNGSQSIVCF